MAKIGLKWCFRPRKCELVKRHALQCIESAERHDLFVGRVYIPTLLRKGCEALHGPRTAGVTGSTKRGSVLDARSAPRKGEDRPKAV